MLIKKYGKYTKRRPFPNFNDFDCSPSGDFSLNEVPDMNVHKMDNNKKNNYINTTTKTSTVVSSSSTTPTGDILGFGNSNSISPVSTISDNSTDFTMVNSNADYITSNSNNPFQIQSEKVNPFSDASEISFSSGYSTTFDGMYPSSTSPRDFHSENSKRSSLYNDDVNYEYNGKNNWKVEIKRYYPNMPQTYEPLDYNNDYNDKFKNTRIPTTQEKKKKWWKKVVPSKKSRKSVNGSVVSEGTFYNSNDVREVDGNPKRYDSKKSSYYFRYNSDRTRNYSNMSNNYDTNKNDYNRYNENLTDDVLVVNKNYNAKNLVY